MQYGEYDVKCLWHFTSYSPYCNLSGAGEALDVALGHLAAWIDAKHACIGRLGLVLQRKDNVEIAAAFGPRLA